MNKFNTFYKSFYLTKLFYIIGAVICLVLALSFLIAPLFVLAKVFLLALIVAIILDTVILFSKRQRLMAARFCNDRFSNGDNNEVKIIIQNNYSFSVTLKVIDELPAIFF